MKILLIDFETLDDKPSAVVLSAAVDIFDPYAQDSYENILKRLHKFKFDAIQQTKLVIPRTTSKSTIEWWSNQSDEAKAVLKPSDEDITLDKFISEFDKIIFNENPDVIASRHINFDLSILADIYRSYGHDTRYKPMAYWKSLDIPSFLGGMMLDPSYTKVKNDPEGFIPHVAEHDVAKEVYNLQQLMKELNK